MKKNKLIGAIMLISGTCIGAGILALPVSTAAAGFVPSSLLFLVTWLFMTLAGLLILEVSHWLAPGANLVSMAQATLGRWGQALAWTAYLLLLYCLMAAYLSGMNALLITMTQSFFHTHIYPWMGSLALIVLFGAIIYLGAKPIDYINRLLMVGLVIAYAALMVFIAPHVQLKPLLHHDYSSMWWAMPVVITAFGHQIVIPSLRDYLKDDAKTLRLAIWIGSFIPLFVYVLWELLIVGVVPLKGAHGLLAMVHSGQPAVDLSSTLHHLIGNVWLDDISKAFAFFVISTSFVGVSFSLFDFLSDGLRIKKTKLGRLSTALITFIPPLLFALVYPRGFIVALGYGGIFVAVLLCLLPAMMVFSGRYFKHFKSDYRAPGGRLALALLSLFALIVIGIQLF